MSISNFGALMHVNPDEAKRQILAAIVETKGDRKAAAVVLNITHRSLYRSIERLRMWDAIDDLISARGFVCAAGPPRASEKIVNAIVEASGDYKRAARSLEMKLGFLRERVTELRLEEEIEARLSKKD